MHAFVAFIAFIDTKSHNDSFSLNIDFTLYYLLNIEVVLNNNTNDSFPVAKVDVESTRALKSTSNRTVEISSRTQLAIHSVYRSNEFVAL